MTFQGVGHTTNALKDQRKGLKNPARYKMKHDKWLRINTKRFMRKNWENKPSK